MPLWALLVVVITGTLAVCMPAMNAIERRIFKPLSDAVIFAETIASGDITKGIQTDTRIRDEITDLLIALETMRQKSTVSEQISGDIETVASVSTETASSAEQIAQASTDLARLSVEQKRIVGEFRF